MTSSLGPRRSAAGTLGLAALLASAAGAQAAISVNEAKIEGGKLVVSGTASSGAQIRVDGQAGAAFNARAGFDGGFSFSLVYHPGDCVIAVETLVPPYLTAGESAEALVANCGPAGVSPRGAWAKAAAYAVNDLVTHEGSTWRAKRNNAGQTPSEGANWELFAAAGESVAEAAAAGSLRVPPTGPAGGDLQGTYPNPTIRNLVVEANNLVSNAVTNPKIAGGAVSTDKLTNGAVNSAKITDNSVRSVDILNNTILTNDIADNTIISADIQDNALTSADVLADTLTAADLAADSVGASEILADSVGSSEIATGVVGSDELDTVHEHTGPATNVVDGTAHDGIYQPSTSVVSCGVGEDLLSVSVDWTNLGGHNEVVFSGVDSITRGEPDSATVRVAYDGGAGPATWVAVATCIF